MTSKRKPPETTWIARAIVTAMALYITGFALFVILLPSTQPKPPTADAIVALTGEGGRLGPAVALLEQGAGRRLLITGVNRATTKRDLRPLVKGGVQFDCCADLGFEAADTRGNAREAAAWTASHHYASLIVVTTAYHMPRSLLEFGTEMPNMHLIPYAVLPEQQNAPLIARLARLQGEYAKYLVARARIFVLGRG